jgi:hypothetical protein
MSCILVPLIGGFSIAISLVLLLSTIAYKRRYKIGTIVNKGYSTLEYIQSDWYFNITYILDGYWKTKKININQEVFNNYNVGDKIIF